MNRWRPGAWSHSSVETLLGGCAYHLALDRLLGLPQWDHPKAALGTAFHAAIEEHENERLAWRLGEGGNPAGAPFEIMEYAAQRALDQCNVRWTGKYDPKWVMDSAYAALTHWWDTPIPNGQPGAGGSLRDRIMEWQPVAVEQRYSLRLPDVTARRISGIPDVVYLDEQGELVVVDQKSTDDLSRYPTGGSTARIQLANYSRACVEATNLPPVRRPAGWPRAEIHVSRTTTGTRSNFQGCRVVAVEPTDDDIRLADQRLRLADEEAAYGGWPKNPSWFLCKPEWCPFHHDAGGPCDPDGPPEFDVVTGFPQPEPIPAHA